MTLITRVQSNNRTNEVQKCDIYIQDASWVLLNSNLMNESALEIVLKLWKKKE